MTYEPFSTVVVPFPFVDSNQTKKRPAIVLSNKEHQQHTGHITLLMITSSKNTVWHGDSPITDLKSAGLEVDSVMRQKIFTIDSRLIMRRLGEISAKDHKALIAKIRDHLKF